MKCPACKVDLMFKDDHYQCPTCDGEYFPAEYFKKMDLAYMPLWEWSMTVYWKAMRDERETARIDRKSMRMAGI